MGVSQLEEAFGISVTESETVPENLGSAANSAAYVGGKLDRVGLAAAGAE